MAGVLDTKTGKIIGRFNYPPTAGLDFSDQKNDDNVSRAVQASKDEADINKIMARALKTGVAFVNNKEATYGDFTGADFLSMQQKIAKINEDFMLLPADVREQFGNSPAAVLDFISKEENLEKSVELGLLPKELLIAKQDAALLAEKQAREAKAAADAAAAAAEAAKKAATK